MTMASLLFFIATLTTTGSFVQGSNSNSNINANLVERQEYVCDTPTAGCRNGMFNAGACECECINPFCPDDNGDCTNASGACGGNPWTLCTRGTNCPWWSNPLKAESCTTGPNVPAGLWAIYNAEDICCKTNFPYSTSCLSIPETESPTKHPTMARPLDDDYETIPMRFDIKGIPDSVSIRDLKQEMILVLKRILLRLADRIEGLKISGVEEKTVVQRDRDLMLLRRKLVGSSHQQHQQRALAQDVTFYYNVNVVRDETKKFGPLIIQEIRDSYNEVLSQIQTFSDIKFFQGDIDLNWCVFQNGSYELCVKNPPKPAPAPVRSPTPVVIQSDPPPTDDGGLAGWAIALIIILVLIVVCCAGYWIAVCCFGVANCFAPNDDRYNEDKEIQNNIYMDENRSSGSGYTSRRSNQDRLMIMADDRSRASGYTSRRSGRSRQLALTEGENNQIARHREDDSFTINTRGTKQSSRRTRQGRDPTMYIPGQEDKPDPDTDVLMIEDGSRRYLEDPPLKPKRDPTMYVQGGRYEGSGGDPPLKPQRDPTMFVEGQEDPSVYVEGQRDASMYVEGQRDASMYVEGQRDASMYVEGHMDPSIRRSQYTDGESVQEMYTDDDPRRYGMSGIDEGMEYSSGNIQYDEYEFKHDNSSRSVGQRSRDPSYYVENASRGEASFQTQEPSVSSKSQGGASKSKRSKKSSKSKSGGKTKNGERLRKSLQSEWGSSFPDVSDRAGADAKKRETKSFYN